MLVPITSGFTVCLLADIVVHLIVREPELVTVISRYEPTRQEVSSRISGGVPPDTTYTLWGFFLNPLLRKKMKSR